MSSFEVRKYIIQGIFILIGLAYIARLFHIQVWDESYKTKASDIGKRTIYPARGLIYDRYGKLIVGNEPIYELQVIYNQIEPFDTSKFIRLLGINDSVFHARFKKFGTDDYRISKNKLEPVFTQIPKEIFNRFEEHLHEFPGFYPQVRSARVYPYSAAAHVVGDIGEVSQQEREASGKYYDLGEFIGKGGIEREHEEALRGMKGVQFYLKDHIGRDMGPFKEGIYDTSAVAGKNLQSTLDIELQKYGEKLMKNKRGSIVAIEPKTGEVLAFISSPSFDPNLLVGRDRGKNFNMLLRDTLQKPLINRPLSAQYSPGSIFKLVNGVVAIQDGALTYNTGISCPGAYYISGISVGCHSHPYISNLNQGIQYSCNSYFCNSFRRYLEMSSFKDESEALGKWVEHMYSFGLGERTGIDLPGEKKGFIPTPEYYDKVYKGWRWKASTIISIAIGQGEILMTPLQMANLYTAIANKGWYYPPHLAKNFENEEGELEEFRVKHHTGVDSAIFDHVHVGLVDVVRAGTARLAQIEGITVAGKTGTVENPPYKDHSTFAAFAPAEDPQIVIAVVVENAGYGGSWAAPIASLMIEMYINREIKGEMRKWHEKRILDANFLDKEKQKQ